MHKKNAYSTLLVYCKLHVHIPCLGFKPLIVISEFGTTILFTEGKHLYDY